MSGVSARVASARRFTVINVGFFSDKQGILRSVQLFLGIICLSLVAYYCGRDMYGEGVYSGFRGSSAETYFLLVTFSCFKVTLILFASYVVSLSTATVLPKTFVEVIYHGLAVILYLTASISLLVVVVQRNSKLKLYRERGYGGLIAAGVFGLINTILYSASFVFSFNSFRRG